MSLIVVVVFTAADLAHPQRRPRKPKPPEKSPFEFVDAPRGLAIGDVELTLGMPQDAAMQLLASRYRVQVVSGSATFLVTRRTPNAQFDPVGAVDFSNGQLTSITRILDTDAWPANEGFSVGQAIYEAIDGSIRNTDSDGAKRATAKIVTSNRTSAAANFKTIAIYIADKKISVTVWDDAEGKRVNADVTIRVRPW